MAADQEMGLIDHLDELRWRVIIALIVVVLIAIVAYIFRDFLLALLTEPIAKYYQFSKSEVPGILEGVRELFNESGKFGPSQVEALTTVFERGLRQLTSLTFIHPTEAFISFIKLALYTGVLVGSPVLLFQVWRFIMPALYDKEKRYFFGAFTVGSLLFYLGVIFSFQIVFPFVIQFLIDLGDNLTASLTISNYISFTMMFLLVFGLVFELPVLVFLAVRTGLTTVEFLRQKRRYLYVFAFVGAALITPPDVVSQVAIGFPVIILFEISLWVSHWAQVRREKTLAAALEDEADIGDTENSAETNDAEAEEAASEPADDKTDV
jgi:sec-independent protein translocase protein TatC